MTELELDRVLWDTCSLAVIPPATVHQLARDLKLARIANRRLRGLVRHCRTHAGQPDCGVKRMDPPMRELYRAVVREKVADD